MKVALPQIRCQLQIMQSNMTMMERVIINCGKLHGNISRNGYGNAIIGRYGGCFEESICPWTRISQKRTHILIAKVYFALEAKYYYACPKRDRFVGKKFHRSSPTATHKEDNQKSTSCSDFIT